MLGYVPLLRSMQQVVEGNQAVGRAQTKARNSAGRPFRVLDALEAIAARAWVAKLALRPVRCSANFFQATLSLGSRAQISATADAGVAVTSRQKFERCGSQTLDASALEARCARPFEAQPLEVREKLVDVLGAGPLGIDVLNSQDHVSASALGVPVRQEERARVA